MQKVKIFFLINIILHAALFAIELAPLLTEVKTNKAKVLLGKTLSCMSYHNLTTNGADIVAHTM